MTAKGDAWQERYRATLALVLAEPLAADLGQLVGSLHRICRSVRTNLVVAGAAVTLFSAEGSHGVVAASDPRCLRLGELQFTMGEGPCHLARETRRPVLVPDLRLGAALQWPGFASAALSEGAAAAFAFPLQVGGASFGVLDIFADVPGALSEEHLARALCFAQIATEVLLDGNLLTPKGDLDPGLERALDYRAEIYQAQGMLMVSLGVSLGDALALMRAHAFRFDRPLVELAREIVAGRADLGDTP